MSRDSLVGRRFGRLVVLQEYKADCGSYRCVCKCDCGNTHDTLSSSLVSGKTKSCGCLRKEGPRFTNGMSKTRFYRIYRDIRRRCDSPKSISFVNYGARGITYEWKSFDDFKDDMYDSYLAHVEQFGEENTSIDRIDVNGNYCKENCRWATRKEQNSNQRKTIFVTLPNGEAVCLKDYCKANNLIYTTIQSRIYKLGWSVDDAITTPIRARSK